MITLEDQIVQMLYLTLFTSVQVSRRDGIGCDLDIPARMLDQQQIVGGRFWDAYVETNLINLSKTIITLRGLTPRSLNAHRRLMERLVQLSVYCSSFGVRGYSLPGLWHKQP